MSTTFVTVLRAGGDFLPEHVQAMAEHVPGLICLADQPVPGVETRPLQYGWKGWWAKMEAYGPSITGDILMLDLDTIVRRLPALPAVSTVLPDFYRPADQALMGSGFLFVTEADRARIWEKWILAPEGHMASCTTRTCWGDQGFLAPFLAAGPRWGSNVVSYKVHCRMTGVPASADIICFHGQPRPWATRLWKGYVARR